MSPRETEGGEELEIKEGGKIARPEKPSEVQDVEDKKAAGVLGEALKAEVVDRDARDRLRNVINARDKMYEKRKDLEWQVKEIARQHREITQQLVGNKNLLDQAEETVLGLSEEVAESEFKKAGLKLHDCVTFEFPEGVKHTGVLDKLFFDYTDRKTNEAEGLIFIGGERNHVKLSDIRHATPEEAQAYDEAELGKRGK